MLADLTDAPLYVVHVSAKQAVAQLAAARDRGKNVFGETCPQYLYLSLEEQLGATGDPTWGDFEGAKWVCSTPLRSREEGHQDAMWQGLRTNDLQMVSTDHCPFCMKDQKELGKGDFRAIPNGIGSIEHRMDLLYQGVVTGELTLERWVELTSTTPARMFGLYGTKGVIAPGADADIVVYDPTGHTSIGYDKTHHMNMDHSAWEGYEIDGHVDVVISRGSVLVSDGDLPRPRRPRPLPQARPHPVPLLIEGIAQWTSASCCRPTRRPGAPSGWPSRPRSTASTTSGPSTRTCSGRSRTSSTRRSSPRPTGSSSGPMVTNPATRDWTVTASVFATLNEMYGNRTVCGIGRGDSAVRVLNGKPTTLKDVREATHVIRELANCRPVEVNGTTLQFPWARTSELEVWIAAYGPLALKATGEVGDGFILQLADVDIAKWMIAAVRDAAEKAGRDPDAITFCVAAPMYVGDDSPEARAHMRDQCRWFGGMVGNHVADIVAKYGGTARASRSRRR